MEIDRRGLLKATCLVLTGLASPTGWSADLRSSPILSDFHPLTRLLLHRAQLANTHTGPVDQSKIERVIREMSSAQGYANPPVIKWLADPFDAFAYLSRLGLDELLQMGNAKLWRRAGPQMPADDDRLNSAAVLGSWIAGLVRSAEHDRALMAPKLLSKARVLAENASAEVVFKIRAVAAQIGWLETCMPVVAAQAVTDVELFLSSGASEEPIHHQLRVFEAYELGLLATWETPDVVICVPRTLAA
jgi:hypothetical protein